MMRVFFKIGRFALPVIVTAVVSFGRTMPATVDQANAEFRDNAADNSFTWNL